MSAPDELWVVLKDGAEPMPGVYSSVRAAAKDAATYERGDDRCGAWYEETRYVLAEKSIRAPDSAPNGLADELERLILDWRKPTPHLQSSVAVADLCERNLDIILAALRNQPGGADVPRRPTKTMRQKGALALTVATNDPESISMYVWQAMYDAATKAGEE